MTVKNHADLARRCLLARFFAAAFAFFTSPVLAQTTWTDATGDWFNAANWSAGVPTSSTDAQINNGGTAQIASAGATAKSVVLGSSAPNSGTLSVSGVGTLTDSGDLFVGNLGTGTLNITNGGAVSDANGSIAVNPGSTGTATVNGVGSTWTNSANVTVGESGTGTLNITSRGTVFSAGGFIGFNAGSTGTANVDGAGSNWALSKDLTIGQSGVGTLKITSGGAVSDVNGLIGNGTGSTGTATVDGAGSTWTNSGDVFVGNLGTGTLNITNGGAVSDANGSIAVNPGSTGTVTVDGAGSTWTNSANVAVGESGTGTLNIINGGAVSDANAFIGFNPGSTGTATVDGAGSTWTNISVYVGGSAAGAAGTGLLRVLNGGTVTADLVTVWNTGTLEIGVNPILNTALRFDGGTLRTIANTTLTNGADLTNSGVIVDSNGFTSTLTGSFHDTGGLTKINPGTIILTNVNTYTGDTNINGGTLQIDGSITSNTFVNSGGTLAGTGTVFGNLSNSGIVGPGDSPGTLTINGNYTQNSNGTLRIELGGLAAGVNSDLLQMTGLAGTASLAGTLQLVRFNNLMPLPGDEVVILTAANGRVGAFDAVVNNFPGLIQPTAVYDPNDVQVLFVLSQPFASQAQTPNQESVGEALDHAFAAGCVPELIRFVGNEPLGNLPHDYDLIAPEELTSIYDVGFANALVQGANFQRRLSDVRAGALGYCEPAPQVVEQSGGKGADGKTVMSDKNVGPVVEVCPDKPWGVFATGIGQWTEVRNDNNADGYDIVGGGITTGADYRIGHNFAIGIGGGYTHSTAKLINGGEVDVSSRFAGLYASVFSGGFYVDAVANGGWNNYETRRLGLGAFETGSTDGAEFTGLIGGGYDWRLGCFTIGPAASFQYTYVEIDSFTESDSTLAPLHFPDQSQEAEHSTLGLKFTYEGKQGNTILRPEIRAAWQHEFGDEPLAIDSQFVGCPDIFRVHGPKTGHDSALLDAGFSLIFGRCHNVAAYVFYNGNIGRDNYDQHAVTGGLRVSF